MIPVQAVFIALALVLPSAGEPKADQQQAIAQASKDVPRLLELARAWGAAGDETAAHAAFARVLEVDKENEEAHKGLRHHRYDGRWFDTYSALSRYRRGEEERMLKDKGLVRFDETWVKPEERTWLAAGLAKNADGAWIGPATRARIERETELAGKGHQQQDLEWIAPADFETWKKGLWKCGDQWLDLAAADAYHATIEKAWVAPGERFVAVTTMPREQVEWVKWWADATWDDLVRIFGVKPGERPTPLDLLGPKRDKPTVAVFRTLAQYNDFAAGNQAEQRPVTEVEGFSSLHYAFFAEAWFDFTSPMPVYRGSGAAFWEKDNPVLAPFGQHSIRHAAAQSYIEAIDPSWNTLSGMQPGAFQAEDFWNEKEIPRWLRYGAASYAERYFIDGKVGKDGDPAWARKWALANLKEKGGIGKLEKVFDFALTLDDIDGSARLIQQAGAVIAFVLDGGEKDVEAAHKAFQEALKRGDGARAAAGKLQETVTKKESALRKFAGA